MSADINRDAATADYFSDDEQMHAAAWWLHRERRPRERCGLLRILADGERRRGAQWDETFGVDYNSDSARLLAILSETEHCRAHQPAALQSVWYAAWHDSRTIELQSAVEHLLEACVTGGPTKRLHTAICDTWAPMVGGDAIESARVLGLPPRRWRWAGSR